MRRPGPPPLAASAALALALAAGCSEVIGLGPEPTRATEGTGNLNRCGLARHPNEPCTECAETSCCAEARACAAEEGCAEEALCAVACAFDLACIAGCNATYQTRAYTALQGCQVSNCIALCFPASGTRCNDLIACCPKVPPGTAKDICASAVNENNEQGCRDVLATGVLAPYCPELTP
ncbi:MAG TPA: hypothetical protein VFS43_34220 [Polyangiaceae bacterium]|nr:hypothetical protein [Polyangiaceae bacterium]